MIAIYSNSGNYSLFDPNKIATKICINFDGIHSLSAIWPDKDAPSVEGVPPSEIVDLLKCRLNDYIFNSSRDKDNKVIEWAETNADALDEQWAKEQITKHEKIINKLKLYIRKSQ